MASRNAAARARIAGLRGARVGGGRGGAALRAVGPRGRRRSSLPRGAPAPPPAAPDGPSRAVPSRCVPAQGGRRRDARPRNGRTLPRPQPARPLEASPTLVRPGLRGRRGGGVVLSRPEEPAAFPVFRKTPLGVRAAGECSCQQLPCEQSAAIQSSLDVSAPAVGQDSSP